MSEGRLADAVARVAARCGLDVLSEPRRVPGGRNNRGYRVDTGGAALFVKSYRPDAGGRRRLRAEFEFASVAWRHGLRCLAEPLFVDEESAIAAYAFVEGARLEPSQVDAARVREAGAFVAGLARLRHAADARALGEATEACFTIRTHLAMVERRVAALSALESSDDVDRAAAAFVADRLRPAWNGVRAAVESSAYAVDEGASGAEVERCLSPSDFGFHNALLGSDDRLVFHDFEYAGWDDPAKMVCDFFCQPELPAPAAGLDAFRDETAAVLGLSDAFADRVAVLMPAFRVKWSCIILNEFLAVGRGRREFADAASVTPARKRAQLDKARAMLATVEGGG